MYLYLDNCLHYAKEEKLNVKILTLIHEKYIMYIKQDLQSGHLSLDSKSTIPMPFVL